MPATAAPGNDDEEDELTAPAVVPEPELAPGVLVWPVGEAVEEAVEEERGTKGKEREDEEEDGYTLPVEAWTELRDEEEDEREEEEDDEDEDSESCSTDSAQIMALSTIEIKSI